MAWKNKVLKDTLQNIKKGFREYVYGDSDKNKLTEMAKEQGISLTFTENLEKDKYAQPFYLASKSNV